MIRAHLLLAIMLCLPLPVFATPPAFCDALAALGIAAANPADTPHAMIFPDGAQTETSCTPALELGGVRSLSCNWSYPYRAPEAQVAFEALIGALATCIGAPVTSDISVNHPDTYDLLMFEDGVSAALKDKVNLGETLVILRVQG